MVRLIFSAGAEWTGSGVLDGFLHKRTGTLFPEITVSQAVQRNGESMDSLSETFLLFAKKFYRDSKFLHLSSHFS